MSEPRVSDDEDYIIKLEADVARLREREERAVAEHDMLRAEVERLRADGTIASLAVAIARAEQAETEMERLRAERNIALAVSLGGKLCISEQHKLLEAEVERLEAMLVEARTLLQTATEYGSLVDKRAEKAEAEVARLRAALREISLLEDDPLRASKTRSIIARAALRGEEGKKVTNESK